MLLSCIRALTSVDVQTNCIQVNLSMLECCVADLEVNIYGSRFLEFVVEDKQVVFNASSYVHCISLCSVKVSR